MVPPMSEAAALRGGEVVARPTQLPTCCCVFSLATLTCPAQLTGLIAHGLSEHAMVAGVPPSSPRYLPSISISHRVRHSQRSSTFIEFLRPNSLVLSATDFAVEECSTVVEEI